MISFHGCFHTMLHPEQLEQLALILLDSAQACFQTLYILSC